MAGAAPRMHIDLAGWQKGLRSWRTIPTISPASTPGGSRWRWTMTGKRLSASVLPTAPPASFPMTATNGPGANCRTAVWARRRAGPQDVVKPGDAIYVEPMPATAKAGEYGLRQVPEVNGAIVAMDPHTGRVLAHVGRLLLCVVASSIAPCRRCVSPVRPSSRSSMPTALEQGLHARHARCSMRRSRWTWARGRASGGRRISSGEYLGDTTLRRGLELSRNLMTVRLAQTWAWTRSRQDADPLRRL